MKMSVLALALIALVAAGPSRANARDYVLMLPVVKGLSMGSLSRLMDDFTKVMSAKLNVKFTMKEYSYPKGYKVSMDLLQQAKAGKADFLYMDSIEYLLNKKEIDKVLTPYFTILMLKKNQTDVCAYVKKDSPYKSMKDLKGKTWGGVETLPARYLMYMDGVKTPMAKFFGKLKYVNDADITKPLDAIIAGDIDVYVTSSFIVEMAKGAKDVYRKDMRELSCETYEHNWIFFHKNDVPEDMAKKVKTALLRAHKDKDFAQFQFLLKAIQGNFADFEFKNMGHTAKVAKLIVDNGWLDEEQAFLKPYLKK
jgi:ABC-type phosphate/phosphonate transport system substrate-binding protein